MSANGRPAGVTFVGILIIIVGIFGVIGGVLGLFDAETRKGLGIITLLLTLVISVIYLAVAKGIFDGNNFSRLLVGLVSVISIIVGIFHLLFASGMRLNGLFEAIFSLIILALLYSANARTFFARN
jgi:drug/metabolite transporter (DMT)-like permease